MTSALGAVMVIGLFLDGWDHINLLDGKLGSFFSPWHALLYAGFSATAVWVLLLNQHLIRRSVAPGPHAQDFLGVPLRYPLAVVGIGIATVGLGGDLIWHSAFGEEAGVARVIGPFHTLLFAGAGLLVSASFRSAWHAPDAYPVAPSFRTILPPLLSLTLATAMAAFIFQWVSAFMDWDPSLRIDRLPGELAGRSGVQDTAEIVGVARIATTNLVLMGALLLALRRWRLPFGSATLLFVAVATLMSALAEFRLGWTILGALAGGLIADALVGRLRASPLRPRSHRVVGGAVPVVLWSVYFGALSALEDVVWPLDLALGTIALMGLFGVVISVLVLPPALPPGAWDVRESGS
ncbi:MAG: hypothetical protein QOI98_919 [Solirubrobacteraceae bacterium]|nr:hypothetical protein [Solirubrobacteraceae bacterium]